MQPCVTVCTVRVCYCTYIFYLNKLPLPKKMYGLYEISKLRSDPAIHLLPQPTRDALARLEPRLCRRLQR